VGKSLVRGRPEEVERVHLLVAKSIRVEIDDYALSPL
jgi:hypothetical protein